MGTFENREVNRWSSKFKIDRKMLTRSKRRRLEEEEDPVIVSSHYELEREAKIKRAKVELMSLKVVDLRRELGTFGLPKTDLVDRLALHKLVPRPFDSLPDEVLLKIVRMASWKSPLQLIKRQMITATASKCPNMKIFVCAIAVAVPAPCMLKNFTRAAFD